MNKEDWITKEQSGLELEARKFKNYKGSDTLIMSKFLLLLLPLLCIGIYLGSMGSFSSLNASEEVQWKCSCGTYNSSSKTDGFGKHACASCGKRK